MKVTVLIAVYNTEAYLTKCLDSLLSQTYTNWEAICVDDCSTDRSLNILNEYASHDKRFRVIHLNENQGQAKARNLAIKESTGDLFCFLDSDDWFSPDSLSSCVSVFEKYNDADCVLFRLIKEYGERNNVEYSCNFPFPLSGNDAFVASLDWSIHGVYMVRGDIQRKILYDDTCRSYSDDNSTRLHYLSSRKVYICNGTYHYRQNPTSVSYRKDISHFNFLLANEHMQQMLRDMHMDDHILNIHENVRHRNLIGCYIFYCVNRHSWSSSDRHYAIETMKRIWKTIEPKRLSSQIRHHIAYCPVPSWFIFRIQQEVFHFLRKLLK